MAHYLVMAMIMAYFSFCIFVWQKPEEEVPVAKGLTEQEWGDLVNIEMREGE